MVLKIFSFGINPSFITLIFGMESAERACSSLVKILFLTGLTARTSFRFWAVTAVMAATPYTPKKLRVARSAVVPAPFELSVAAMVSTVSNIFITVILAKSPVYLPASSLISLLMRMEQNFGPHIEQNSEALWQS